MKRIGWGLGYATGAFLAVYWAMSMSVGPWDFTVYLTRPLAGVIALVAAAFAFRLGWQAATETKK